MPFFTYAVPKGWLAFDGRVIDGEKYPDLWDILYYSENAVHQIWTEKLGGAIDSLSITLPDIDARRAWELSYNMAIDGVELPDMTLAIKAERPVIDDAS